MPGFGEYVRTSKRHSKSSFVQQSSGPMQKPAPSSLASGTQQLEKKKKKKKKRDSAAGNPTTLSSSGPPPPRRRSSQMRSAGKPRRARGLKSRLEMIRESSKENLIESFRNMNKSFKKSVKRMKASTRKLQIPEEDTEESREQGDPNLIDEARKNAILNESSSVCKPENLGESSQIDTACDTSNEIDKNKVTRVSFQMPDETNDAKDEGEKKVTDSNPASTGSAVTTQARESAPKASTTAGKEFQATSISEKAKSSSAKKSSVKATKKVDAFAAWKKQAPQKTVDKNNNVKSGVRGTTSKKDAFAAWTKK